MGYKGNRLGFFQRSNSFFYARMAMQTRRAYTVCHPSRSLDLFPNRQVRNVLPASASQAIVKRTVTKPLARAASVPFPKDPSILIVYIH